MQGWIKQSEIFDARIRAFRIGLLFLQDVDITFSHGEWPFQLDEALKKIGMVPKDAWMRGYFFEQQRAGIVVHYIHRSFPEVKEGVMIEIETAELSNLPQRGGKVIGFRKEA